MDGFALGVKYYIQQHSTYIEVLGWDPALQTVLFIGNFTSFTDGYVMGATLMAEGADIIMEVAGPAGLGTAAAIKEHGNAFFIGVDTDWYYTAPVYQEVILTSVMKNTEATTFLAIQSVLEGNFAGGNLLGTLENGGVGLAPFHDLGGEVPAVLMLELDLVKAGIINGTIATSPD